MSSTPLYLFNVYNCIPALFTSPMTNFTLCNLHGYMHAFQSVAPCTWRMFCIGLLFSVSIYDLGIGHIFVFVQYGYIYVCIYPYQPAYVTPDGFSETLSLAKLKI